MSEEVEARVGMSGGRPWNFTAFAESTEGGVRLAGCCRMRLGGRVGPGTAKGGVVVSEPPVGGSSTAERVIRAQCGLEGSLRSRLRYSWRLEADSLGWTRKELRTFTF